MGVTLKSHISRSRSAESERAPRDTCLRCRRPKAWCWCAHVPRLEPRTRVVLLQHPRERDVAIGTARMAHLALAGSVLVEGIRLDEHPAVRPLFDDPDVAVLFPGEDAKPLEEWLDHPPKTLVVVDGTWSQAKKLLKLNPRLGSLPRLSYRPTAPGNYRIRKEPSDECLATVEAVAAVLGALEGDAPRYASLLEPFTYMVDRQIEAIQATQSAGTGRARFRRRKPDDPGPGRRLPELFPLVRHPERAVLLYGEANAQRRGVRVAGAPEILQLVAVRPATGARMEEILAPRRPLGDDVPKHIQVDAATLLAGGAVEPALARFRAFFDEVPGSVLCCWGPHARDLLAREGEPPRGFIDVRALHTRTWGRTSGGIPGCAAALDVTLGVDVTPWAQGRAGRMMALLEPIYGALLERATEVVREEAKARGDEPGVKHAS